VLEREQSLEQLIVVPNDDRTEPISASQFQPPSPRRSSRIRSTIGETSTPKYAPVSIVRPLMHGSTSPSKYRCPACSHRPFSATSAIALRADCDVGSSPSSCNVCSVCIVAVQGWPGSPPR
jgi:hypothetical protein